MVQKKQEITYRDLQKEDYPRLEKMIGDTWGFGRRCNGYTGALKAPVRCFGNHLSEKRKSLFRTDS